MKVHKTNSMNVGVYCIIFLLLVLPITGKAAQEVFVAEITSASPSSFTPGQSATVTVRIRSTSGSGNVVLEADNWTSGWSVSPKNRNPTINQGTYYDQTFTVTAPSGNSSGTIVWKLYDDDYGIHPSGSRLLATRNQSVSATLPSFTMNATAGTGGTVSPSSRIVTQGNTTTFTVSPSTGYTRGSVSGDASGGSWSGNIYTTAAVTQNRSLTFSFVPNTYTVNATAGTGGTVSPASRSVTHGNKTTFTVSPSTGYTRGSVSGDASGGSWSGNTYTTAAVTQNRSLTFSFVPNTYTVNATAGTGGTVSPASRSVTHGNTTTFTVSPSIGYTRGSVSGDASGGSWSGNIYTTAPVTQNRNLTFSFTPTFGSISATLKNSTGTNALASGTRFLLYTSPTQSKSGSNPANYTNINPGTYLLEGYYSGTFFGEEFWTSGQFQVTAGNTTTATLTRNYPFASQAKFYNNSTNVEISAGQNIAPGTVVRAEVTVQNNVPGTALNSKVRLLFDLSQSSPYDSDQTSAFQSISGSGGTKTYSFLYTPTATGPYYYALDVQTTLANGNTVRTDSWTWTQTFKVQLGAINATLKNFSGTTALASGSRFLLYTSPTQSKSGSNPASYTNITPGTYLLEGYYSGTFFGEEFWTSAQFQVTAGNTTTATLTRDYPFASQVSFYNNSTGAEITAGQSVVVGTVVRAEVTVQNNVPGTALNSKVRLLLDLGQSSPYDSDQTSAFQVIAGSGGTKKYTFTYTVNLTGQFYNALEVLTTLANETTVRTDSWTWGQVFIGKLNTGSINATLNNFNGTPALAAGTKFLLYTSPLQTKTGLNPAVFTGINVGTYLLEGYQTRTFFGEEFWHSQQVSVPFDSTTNTTLTRTYPFASDVKIYNNSTGLEVVAGQSLPFGTTVRAEVLVQNNVPSTALNSKVRFLFDVGQSSSYDSDQTSAFQMISGSGGTKKYIFDYVVNLTGQFYYALEVQTTIANGNTVRTDSWTWIQTLNVPDLRPVITSFAINNGAASTNSRTVTLNNMCTNSPTHYMVSESPSFSGASWMVYSAAPTFTLSSSSETKTVYFKVKNNNGESIVVASDSISYIDQTGQVTVYSSQSYSAATYALNLSAQVSDTLYGNITSGTFTYTLKNSAGVSKASGNLNYNSGAGEWRGAQTISGGLAAGNYDIYYNVTTDRGRTGSLKATLVVGISTVTINGIIRDSATKAALSGAKVALFDASVLWSFVNANHNGTMPSLETLLTQLTPMRGPILTSANGAYAWNDVQTGGSCVVIAGKAGYLGNFIPSFPISATNSIISKDILLSIDTANTLAVLLADVDNLLNASKGTMEYNAGIIGEMTSKVKTDNLYSNPDLLSLYSDVAGWIGVLNPGSGVASLSSAIGGISMNTLTKAIAAHGLINASKKILNSELVKLTNRTKNDIINQSFPLNQAGFEASEYHTVFINSINISKTDFDGQANGLMLNSDFDITKAKLAVKQIIDAMNNVQSGHTVFLVSPSPDNGIGMLKLETMTRQYDELSARQAVAAGTEAVLSTVQIAGTAITVGSAATGVGAPVAGVAAVATTASGLGKYVVQQVRVVLKFQMAYVFIDALVGTYPEDNSLVQQEFANSLDFLIREASSPYYLKRGNTFMTETTVDLNLLDVFGKKFMFTAGIPGFDIAQGEATVGVRNTGNVATKTRVTGYGVWSPITLTSMAGLGARDILTCSEMCGPVQLATGNSTQMKMQFRGHSRNFFSLFKPHYLTVDTYSGPWHTNQITKQYYVIGLGENPVNFVDLIGFGSSAVAKESYYAPLASSEGRISMQTLQSQISGTSELINTLLSAANPSVTTSFIADANLYASDLRLFAPQDTNIAILVTSSSGKRIGYNAGDGMSYNELVGSVTNMGQRPISLRLLRPPAGEIYTVAVSLLSPGPDDIAVSLFYEPVKLSGAVVTAFPSQLIIDGNDGTTRTALLRLAEASGQKALTDVNVTLDPIRNWNDSVTLPVVGPSYREVGDIPAGEQSYVSWDINFPAGIKRGKYTGQAVVTSGQTSELVIPVIALVRDSNQTVTFYEGSDPNHAVVQKSLTIGADGRAQTWVHLPSGFTVLHAGMGVVAGSANLQNPSIDIGEDGSTEWAFSGKFDLGVLVDNIEHSFNDYIVTHSPVSGGTDVPIAIRGTPGEVILLNGIQLYLDTTAGIRKCDLNRDNILNYVDLGIFAQHWLNQQDADIADIVPDGGDKCVNLKDFSQCAFEWLLN